MLFNSIITCIDGPKLSKPVEQNQLDFTSVNVPDCPKEGDVQPSCLTGFSGAVPSATVEK